MIVCICEHCDTGKGHYKYTYKHYVPTVCWQCDCFLNPASAVAVYSYELKKKPCVPGRHSGDALIALVERVMTGE
jgi:hypothetical protein